MEVRDFKKKAKEGKTLTFPIKNFHQEEKIPHLNYYNENASPAGCLKAGMTGCVMQNCLCCENIVTWSRGTSLTHAVLAADLRMSVRPRQRGT